MFMLFTIFHPLVDFCSVAVLAMGGVSVERWLVYNALAFALQLPLGTVLDARPGWLRGLFVAGVALTVAGVACAVAGGAAGVRALGWGALAMACVGNALFHLTAGAFVLERTPGCSGPIGLFISTGALGLMAGQMAVKGGWAWAVVPVAVALVAGAAMVGGALRAPRKSTSKCMPSTSAGDTVGVRALSGWLVLGLFALVAWRSWAGLLATGVSSDAGLGFVLAGAAVTWAGKAVGGYAADALQRLRRVPALAGTFVESISPRGLVTALSVAGSAALCFACSPSQATAWLALLFIAQLATGPVLSLMYDAVGRRAGTAFGLNCLGLFLGGIA